MKRRGKKEARSIDEPRSNEPWRLVSAYRLPTREDVRRFILTAAPPTESPRRPSQSDLDRKAAESLDWLRTLRGEELPPSPFRIREWNTVTDWRRYLAWLRSALNAGGRQRISAVQQTEELREALAESVNR